MTVNKTWRRRLTNQCSLRRLRRKRFFDGDLRLQYRTNDTYETSSRTCPPYNIFTAVLYCSVRTVAVRTSGLSKGAHSEPTKTKQHSQTMDATAINNKTQALCKVSLSKTFTMSRQINKSGPTMKNETLVMLPPKHVQLFLGVLSIHPCPPFFSCLFSLLREVPCGSAFASDKTYLKTISGQRREQPR